MYSFILASLNQQGGLNISDLIIRYQLRSCEFICVDKNLLNILFFFFLKNHSLIHKKFNWISNGYTAVASPQIINIFRLFSFKVLLVKVIMQM